MFLLIHACCVGCRSDEAHSFLNKHAPNYEAWRKEIDARLVNVQKTACVASFSRQRTRAKGASILDQFCLNCARILSQPKMFQDTNFYEGILCPNSVSNVHVPKRQKLCLSHQFTNKLLDDDSIYGITRKNWQKPNFEN